MTWTFFAWAALAAAAAVPTPPVGTTSLSIVPVFDAKTDPAGTLGNVSLTTSFDLPSGRWGVQSSATDFDVFGDCVLTTIGNLQQVQCAINASISSGTVNCGDATLQSPVVPMILSLGVFQAWQQANSTWTPSTKRGCFVTKFVVPIGLDQTTVCLHQNGLPTFVSVLDSGALDVLVNAQFATNQTLVPLDELDNC